jgi:PAS domain S-box-containing protein
MEPPSPERVPIEAPLPERGEEVFALLVDAVQDYAVFMLDPNGQVSTWNAGAARVKGYARDEIIGKHFSIFYPPEVVRSGWPQQELQLAKERGMLEDESWRVRKDGSRFWANVVITSLRDADGRHRGFSKVTRDLSERKRHEEQLEESRKHFQVLAEAVKDHAIVMLDSQGHVKSWNAGGAAIHGHAAEHILGKHVSAFFTASDVRAGLPMQVLATATRDGRAESQGWRVRQDGSMFWAHVVVTPMVQASGELSGFAQVTRDLTEHKRLAEVESSSQRMKEFLAMLAHELRNPLAPMRNAVSVMQLQQLDHPSLQNSRDVIDRQLTHLTRLVDDLLDIGRISTGKVLLKKSPVSYRELVSLSIEAARPLIEVREHTLSVTLPEPGIQVLADKTRLVQVLQNLLTNAAKYTDAGGQIGVAVRVEGGSVVTDIVDNGRGVSPEALESIFDPFVQANPATTAGESGLGIGLTLARSLAEMHGGTVSASSGGLGQGMTFTLRMPMIATPSSRGTGPSTLAAAQAQVPFRVMVVEDNRDAADSLVATLALMGYEARACYDGVQALPQAQAFGPQLVFIDLSMPRMDGFKVLQQLRDIAAMRSAYMVAMTGHGREDDVRRSLQSGFDAHLTKPASIQQIRSTVASAMERASGQRG